MRLPALYAIANIENLDDPRSYITSLLDAGVSLLQLRSKSKELEPLRVLTSFALGEISNRSLECSLIINDYIDVCAELGADGVHLGQGDANPIQARETLGENAIIGLSSHSAEQAGSAPFEALSYLAFGPVFSSSTKVGHAAVTGTEALRTIVELSPLPVVAIGGITQSNVGEIFGTGAESAAVIADLQQAKERTSLVRGYEAERAKALVQASASIKN